MNQHACTYATELGELGRDADWPLLAFDNTGVVCGPWAGDSGVEEWLQANGYTQGYASPGYVIGGIDIDERVAATVPCMACQSIGSGFQAWANEEGRYGMGVAICQNCGHASTF